MSSKAKRRQAAPASGKPKPLRSGATASAAPPASPLVRTLRSFLSHYAALYTPQRFYDSLLPALLAPTTHCALTNPYCNRAEHSQRMEAARAVRLAWTELDSWVVQRQGHDGEERKEAVQDAPPLPAAASATEEKDATVAAITRLVANLSTSTAAAAATDDEDSEDGDVVNSSSVRFPAPASTLPPHLHLYYLLDPSSLLPVQSLALAPHHRVLDMCAAPGGKSLAILFTLASRLHSATNPSSATPASAASYHLTCNELSPARRQRLQRVLVSYLPAAVRSRVSLTAHSATSPTAFAPASFDRVLLDAPCSSSRHLLHSLASLPSSSASAAARSAAYALEQQRMLHVGLRALRGGGRLVYSTCSLSPQENEQVVAGALAKWAQLGVREAVAEGDEAWRGERRQYGRLVLPDVAGYGPLYYCVLEKAADASGRSAQQHRVELDEESDEEESDESDGNANHDDAVET